MDKQKVKNQCWIIKIGSSLVTKNGRGLNLAASDRLEQMNYGQTES